MSSYAPASSLGWLDLDLAASERVATLLRALEQPGTLDALGLGTVRDGFAGVLHPGTSTVQTRLRYFLFLPWICLALEERQVTGGRFAAELKEREARLIDCLRHLGDGQGVIGYHAGRELRRFPSAVYWGGLGSWRIRRLDLSLADYGRRAAAFGRVRPDRDDDGNPTRGTASMWVAVPPPPAGFLSESLDFDLGPGEAEHVVDHLQRSHPRSLLAALCRRPDVAMASEFPWDLPAAVVPSHLVEILRHAQCFSELTVGPQQLYNVLLARKARHQLGWDTQALEDEQTEALSRWAGLVRARRSELQAWVDDLPRCWDVLEAPEAVKDPTRAFVRSMVTRAVEEPESFADDVQVQAEIAHRELLLKAGRARLCHRSALEGWNKQPFGGQLTFRWSTAQTYLADLAVARKEHR